MRAGGLRVGFLRGVFYAVFYAVGKTCFFVLTFFLYLSIIIVHSPVAQLAEQVAVNHWVWCSNHHGGARPPERAAFFCGLLISYGKGGHDGFRSSL